MPRRRATARLLVKAAPFGVPALVVLLVWAPLVSRYHVRAATVTDDIVRQARQSPSDSVLLELNQYRLLKLGPDRKELSWFAQQLRRESAAIAGYPSVSLGYPPVRIGIPRDPRDLEKALPAWQPFFVVDRKSTRLNSSHVKISYAVFCLKKTILIPSPPPRRPRRRARLLAAPGRGSRRGRPGPRG